MAVDARWYVIHTYSGYENKVAGNIEKIVENRKMHDKILGVSIPLEKVVEVKDDKTVEVERMVFPGYVVVKLAVEYDDDNQPQVPNETWHAIRYTRGVTGFVGPESKPIPLTADELDRMLGRLLWLGQHLLDRGLHYEIRALTGEGAVTLAVMGEEDLTKAMDYLLRSEPAGDGDIREQPVAASWQYHVGGQPDET